MRERFYISVQIPKFKQITTKKDWEAYFGNVFLTINYIMYILAIPEYGIQTLSTLFPPSSQRVLSD
jgi:hypothetical protein